MRIARIALRNIGRNRRRSVLSATATAIATMGLVAMMAYINGMRVDMQRNTADLVTGHIQIRHAEYARYEQLSPLHLRVQRSESLARRVAETPGVAAAVPRLPQGAAVLRGTETTGVMLLGMDLERERSFMGIDGLVREGRLPTPGAPETAVGLEVARRLGLDVGDTLTLVAGTLRRSTNAVTLEVVGLVSFPVESMNATHLIAPLDRVQALARMDDSATQILVKVSRLSEIDAVRDRLKDLLTGDWADLEARTWTEASFFLAFFEMAEGLYFVISLVFLLLASTVLINTTMMVVFERTREIGTVGALGMKPGEIVRMFFLEAVYLAVLGAVAGLVLGLAIAIPFSITGVDLSTLTQGMSFEISSRLYFAPSPLSTALIVVYAVVISSLAALIPARRAARIPPVEALRSI